MEKALVVLLVGLFIVGWVCLTPGDIYAASTAVGFRGDLGHTGVYNTTGVPVLHGVKWQFETDGVIASSPVIADGVVYIGSDDTYLYAIDQEKGKEKWKFKTHGPIKSSPAVLGDTVFISSRDGYLYAVDIRNGKLRWKYQAEREDKRVDPWDYYQASPIIYQDMVFFGGWDGYFYGLKVSNGELVQKYQTGRTHATPTIGNGKLYVGTIAGSLAAYDLTTGAQVWEAADSLTVYSSIVYQNGVVYVGVRKGECLQAFNGETGEVIWKFTSPIGSWIQSSPALANDILFTGTSDDLKVYAVDAKSGSLLWTVELPNATHSSPAYAQGVIYIGMGDNYGWTTTGTIYAIDARSGNQLWSYEVGGPVNSSPVVDNGVLYVGSNDGCLYAIY